MSKLKLEISKSKILNDLIIFHPSVNFDIRGNIYTSYSDSLYKSHLTSNIHFKHDKFSSSKKNVLRGLHGDNKTWKLISCVFGEIFVAIVDNRPESKNNLKWDKFILKDTIIKQILIPPNFANGFLVLSEIAIFHYKLAYEGDYFDVENQFVLKWDDHRLNIPWPISNPILQNRDK